ncbi:MAG: CehA/McbA family metallohydrolase, partial [Polyangiales bacterium]
TYVYAPEGPAHPRAVVEGLRRGRAFVTNGPMLELRVDGRRPGATVAAGDGHVDVRIGVRGPGWMELKRIELRMGRSIVHARDLDPAGGTEQTIRVRVPVERSGYLWARVEGSRPMRPLLGHRATRPLAFTNPVWIR